jgi:acyl carrier protein
MHDIQARVFKVLVEKLKKDESKISAQTSLVDDLELDIFDMQELVVELEEEFGIEIDSEIEHNLCWQRERLRTVGDIFLYVYSQIN